ncbi:hypothetical protein BKH31_00080 [Actinomyces oris]|uniref:Uncharacterized protein n=1 Tax=Actinomyces oris TaxID=544580 RepID=A0A1Q8VMD7_9ACTO|nr:hypothetical protein [Actinomyces oris]OLO49264.1 hypothetical protein BKH31_00080 [Actinomyces oris]
MSTEQTGVNAPTSEEPTQDEHAPRGSRRAIRQAERAAEREAILTGQQPLLTRREMRRLREEAKALRAAVEAGEITPEQAQALQDPLADPASVTSRSSSASGDEAESGLGEPAAVDGADYLEQGGQNPPLNLSVPEGPTASAPSWRSLSAAEAVAISEIETGLMEAVDLPVATLDYDAHWAANASSEPAPVPARFSLKDRLEGGSVSEAEEAESPEVDGPQGAVEVSDDAEAEEPATSPYDYREGFEPTGQDDGEASSQSSSEVDAVSAAPAVPAVSATASGAADFSAYEQAAAARTTESARSGLSAGSASSAGSVRRPIVRIPAAAQGVRTVNASTGELSSVQPVDSSPSAQDAADAQDVYDVLSIEEPMAQDDAAVEVDMEAQTMVVPTSAPSTQAAQDSEFGAPGAPQWRSLHQPSQTGSFQEAIVEGTAETAAVSGEAVSPYAFYSDEAEHGNAPLGSSEWDSVAVPAAEAPEEPYLAPVNEVTGRVPTPDHVLPMEQPGSSSRIGKILMAALIIVLLLIIIAVVLGLLILNGRIGGSSSAMAASIGAGEWSRQLV